MNIGETLRERIRVNLLRQMHMMHPLAMRLDDLHTGLTLDGIAMDANQVASELDALVELSFATVKRDALNAAIYRWKLTEGGRVLLHEKGFAE